MTILFRDDFLKEGAVIDTSDYNMSFLKISMLLHRMGVENNKFMLALYQPELSGIDPHTKGLSKELKFKIAYECKINIWYYLRYCCRIPTQGSAPVKFILDRANLCLVWFYVHNIDIFEVIPRQCGKTFSTIAIHSHVIYIGGNNITVSMLTKDTKLRHENVSRLKDLRDALPEYLVYKQTKDSDNKEGVSYTAFNNKYLTFVAQPDEAGADNLARGMTTPTQHWDEIGMFKNIAITYPVALASTNTAVETAKANNQPHSNILTTTAGKLDTKEGKFAHSILLKALTFTEKLYDSKDIDELREIIKSGSSNMMVYATFSYLQLGKTHEWFKEKTERGNASQDDIDRDYLNIWKLGSMQSILTQEMLKTLREYEQDPLHVDIVDGYIIRWYVDKHFIDGYKRIPCILGMDSSENIGRDFTTLVLLDARDMSVIATCKCNESNIIRMGMFIVGLLLRFEQTVYIPERNSTGTAIIDLVIVELQKKNINPFRRIFNQVIQNADEPEFAHISTAGKGPIEGKVRKHFGFKTSGKTRPYLYKSVFNKALELNTAKVRDKDIITEISALSIKNGRIDHQSSGHDDMVIAYLLACYVLFFGKNLNRYGIDQKLMLSQMTESKSDEQQEMEYQQHLSNAIVKLEKKINATKSELLRMSLIKKLNGLKAMVNDDITVIPVSNEISTDKREYEDKQHKLERQVYNEQHILSIAGGV